MKKLFYKFCSAWIYPFNPFLSFKIWCKKVEGLTDKQFKEYEEEIMKSPTLKKHFRIKEIVV